MTINELRTILLDRLENLKEQYNRQTEYQANDKLNDLCYERNKINDLLITFELKAQIKEVERTLMLLEFYEKRGNNESTTNI